MAQIQQAEVIRYLDGGKNAITLAERGRAFEDLVCYVFGQVPGIFVRYRDQENVFETEEIDIAFWNEKHPEGFFFLPYIVLVECKNWSDKVGSSELAWFDRKVADRGLDFGMLLAASGITGDPKDLTAARFLVATALANGRRLIVVRSEELLGVSDSVELVRLVEAKFCELAVKGSCI